MNNVSVLCTQTGACGVQIWTDQAEKLKWQRHTQKKTPFCNSAITKPLVCARIVVEMGSHPTRRFLFNHTIPFLTKGLEKSLCNFTGTIFVQCENPISAPTTCAARLSAFDLHFEATVIQSRLSAACVQFRVHSEDPNFPLNGFLLEHVPGFSRWEVASNWIRNWLLFVYGVLQVQVLSHSTVNQKMSPLRCVSSLSNSRFWWLASRSVATLWK